MRILHAFCLLVGIGDVDAAGRAERLQWLPAPEVARPQYAPLAREIWYVPGLLIETGKPDKEGYQRN